MSAINQCLTVKINDYEDFDEQDFEIRCAVALQSCVDAIFNE